MLTHDDDDEQAYACDDCGEEFDSQTALDGHEAEGLHDEPSDAAPSSETSEDALFERAVDAAFESLAGFSPQFRAEVADALRAAHAVYAADEKAFVDGQVAQANILGWRMDADVTDVQVSMAMETAAALVSAAKTFLTVTGAQNYVEQHVHDRETGERYTLTIQRPGKKTPHELRREAEAVLDERLAQVNRVVTVVNTWQRWREQADDGAPFAELYDQVLAALDGQDDMTSRPNMSEGGAADVR